MQSEQINEIATALALAQAEIHCPPRNRTVKVKGRTKSGRDYTYDFRYATLDAVIEAVRGPLTKNGLWFVQLMGLGNDGRTALLTRLVHKSGQWMQSVTPIVQDEAGGNQEFGSTLTYMRRYALTSVLGISAEEDDDANAADGNEVVSSNAPASRVKSADGSEERSPEATKPKFDSINPPISELAQRAVAANDNGFDYLNWGIKVADKLTEAAKPVDIGKILKADEERLELAKTEAPNIHARLMAVLAEARERVDSKKKAA